jgi:hypothetical protein
MYEKIFVCPEKLVTSPPPSPSKPVFFIFFDTALLGFPDTCPRFPPPPNIQILKRGIDKFLNDIF